MSTTKGNNPVTGTVGTVEVVEVEATQVEATQAVDEATDEAVIVFEGDTVTIDGVLVDRKKLDTKLVGKFKSAETTLTDISVLIAECQEAKVWLDPKVRDDNGNAFKNWATYLSDRLSKYPLANKALSNTMLKALLAAGMSVRAAGRAAHVSHGKAHSVNQELKGENGGKRAPRPNDGTGSTEDPKQDEAGLSSTVATDAKKAATQAVNALLKVDGLVVDMAQVDRDRVIAAAEHTIGILKGMTAVQGTEPAEADAAA